MSFPSWGGGCFLDSTPSLSLPGLDCALCRGAGREQSILSELTSVNGSGEEVPQSRGGGGGKQIPLTPGRPQRLA